MYTEKYTPRFSFVTLKTMKPHHILPNTLFRVDPALDIKGYNGITHLLPSLCPAFTLPTNQEEVTARVETAHAEHAEALRGYTDKVAEVWQTKEETFFRLASELFSIQDFPTETYTCYPTIWPLIARDPMAHTVAFPFNVPAEEACHVIAHEFLHELFFHRLWNTFGETIDLNSSHVWNLSEVVNVLILRSKEWQEVFPFPVAPYPQHETLLLGLEPVWNKNHSIDDLVRSTLK